MKKSIKKSVIKEMVRRAINEVYYSSGDLGIEYDPYEGHENDLSIEDYLSDDELNRIYAEDEYDKAMSDDGYVDSIARERQDYEDNAPMDIDENIKYKLVKIVTENVVKKLKYNF